MLIDDDISAMNSNIHVLRSLRQNMDKENVSHREIMSNQETETENIDLNENLSAERALLHIVVRMNRSSAEEILGAISREERIISMPDLQKRIEEKLIHKTITNTFELKCTGTFFHDKTRSQICMFNYLSRKVYKKITNKNAFQ